MIGRPDVVTERADAARNRQRVLAAAAELFARRGVEAVTLADVAARAGVGKGTLFRRFGDKAGLAVALLDQRERELQRAVLSGPAPLGPGAPPGPRLQAFLTAYLDYVADNLDLVRMSETGSPGARYRVGSYRFWAQHVGLLLAQARPDLDGDAMAHALLGSVSADLLQGLGVSTDPAYRRAVLALADAVAASGR